MKSAHKVVEQPLCPIAQVEWTKLQDPVVAKDLQIYEGSALKDWVKQLEKNGAVLTSPVTMLPVDMKEVISATPFIGSYRSAIEENQLLIEKNELLAKENRILKQILKRYDQEQKLLLIPESKEIHELQDLSINIKEKERELAAEIFTRRILSKKMQTASNEILLKKQIIHYLTREMKKKHQEFKKQIEQLNDKFDFNPNAISDEKQVFENRRLLEEQFQAEIVAYRKKLMDPKKLYDEQGEQFAKTFNAIISKQKKLKTNMEQHILELSQMREKKHALHQAGLMQAEKERYNTLKIFGGLKEKETLEVKKIKYTVEEKKHHVPEILSSVEQEKLDNDLFEAIKKSDKDLVQNLLNQGANIEARRKDIKYTPLMLAVVMFDLDLVKLLLQNHANSNSSFIINHTITAHPFLNCQIKYCKDSTPLLALFAGSTEDQKMEKNNKKREAIAVELLKHNALLNVQNSEGQTALHEAAKTNCPALVKLLLNYNADPTITNTLGRTALEEAKNLLEDDLSKDIVQILETAIRDKNRPLPVNPSYMESLGKAFS